ISGADAQNAFVNDGGCAIIGTGITLSEKNAARSYNPDDISVTLLYKPGSAHLFENEEGQGFVEHPRFANKLQALFASSTEQHFKAQQHPYGDISATFYQPVT